MADTLLRAPPVTFVRRGNFDPIPDTTRAEVIARFRVELANFGRLLPVLREVLNSPEAGPVSAADRARLRPLWMSSEEQFQNLISGIAGFREARASGAFVPFGSRGGQPIGADSRVLAMTDVPEGLVDIGRLSQAMAFDNGAIRSPLHGQTDMLRMLAEVNRLFGRDPREYFGTVRLETGNGISNRTLFEDNINGLDTGRVRNQAESGHQSIFENTVLANLRFFRRDRPYLFYNQGEALQSDLRHPSGRAYRDGELLAPGHWRVTLGRIKEAYTPESHEYATTVVGQRAAETDAHRSSVFAITLTP